VILTLPIREVVPATPRARIVRLDLGSRAFSYRAGQAVLIAAQGHERRRPYSIASSPEETTESGYLELLVGVEADGQPGPHLGLNTGALVDIEGPIGRFAFPEHPHERRFLFIAGGTGIAPLRSMLRHALLVPHDAIGLLYSARTLSEFAYERELRALAAAGRIELKQTVTREVAPGDWAGTHGRLGRTDLAPLVHHRETLCFICGPGTLVEDMLAALAELGIARERIRIEEWPQTPAAAANEHL
jgi:ferredoxin-NADP reductase